MQNYANFQSDLSTRVLDDISRDQLGLNDEALRWSTDDHDFEGSTLNSDQFQFGALLRPVIIHQQQNSFGNYFWSRNYDPILEQCGLAQQSFSEFIDSFNQYLKVSSPTTDQIWILILDLLQLSPNLEVVNVAALPSSFGDETASSYSHIVISEAAQVLKAAQMRGKNDIAIEHLNAIFLSPLGLMAMVVSSRPSNPSQIINVPSQQPRPSTPSLNSPSRNSSSKRTRVLPSSIAVQAEAQRKSSISSNLPPSLHDSHYNSFSSLISTVMKHREHNTRRRRARRRPVSRDLFDSDAHSHYTFGTRKRETPADEEIDIGGEHSRYLEPVSTQLSGLNCSLANKNCKQGALYLIIINDPSIHEIPSKNSDIQMGKGKAKESEWLGMIDPQLLRQEQRQWHNTGYAGDEMVKAPNEAPPAYTRNIENGYMSPERGWH